MDSAPFNNRGRVGGRLIGQPPGVDLMRKQMADKLMQEVTADKLSWYYLLSMDQMTKMLYGAVYLKARGPAEAHILMGHLFTLQPSSIVIYGPLSDDHINLIPEDCRWRMLNRDEVMAINDTLEKSKEQNEQSEQRPEEPEGQ